MVVPPFYSPSIGGVETVAGDTAEELARRGHDVSVITTTYDSRQRSIADPGVEDKNGVRVYRLRSRAFRVGYARFMIGFKEKLRELKPQILHSHCLHPHLFQSIDVKQDLGVRMFVQLHYPPATGFDHFTARLAYGMVMRKLLRAQEKIDCFIVHNESEKKWLINEGIIEDRIRMLNYPCVRYALFSHRAQPVQDPRIVGRPYILYLGRLYPRKGIHTLIEALQDVVEQQKNTILMVVGSGDQKYYRRLLALTKGFRLSEHIFFKPEVSQSEKYDLMSNCTLFVSPSIGEFNAITLLEAQALGVPVVSTRVGAIEEIVEDGKTGVLVAPNRSGQLAAALIELLNNSERRKEMGRRGIQWMRQNFVLENTVAALEQVYVRSLTDAI